VTLRPVQKHPDVLRIPANPLNPSEYFLVENRPRLEGPFDAPRQVTYFDNFNQREVTTVIGGLPGSGVLIYHVDERRSSNDDRGHLLVAVEEAGQGEIDPVTGRISGSNLLLPFGHPQANRGDAGDPFGNKNKTFTQRTVPTSINYDGFDSGVRITDITAPPMVDANLDKNMSPDPATNHVVKEDNANATLSVRIASIIGAVFAPTASTAPAIQARLLSLAREPLSGITATVEGTEFTFFDVGAGEYLIEITANNFVPQLVPVKVTEGATILRAFLSPQLSNVQLKTGWNMISFPIDFQGRRISDVFGMTDLRSFGWNGEVYVANPVVEAGKGYWIYVTDPARMRIVLPGVASSSDLDQPIQIKRGWNLIGNPFPRAITWDPATIQIQLANGDKIPLSVAQDRGIASDFGWVYRPDLNDYQRLRRGDPVPMYQGFWYYSNVEGNIIVFPAPRTPAG
ncbi:MAG: hypothetical protein KY468_08155, partial [Armatimonadetes bacterium]|nr:hypothetical protein [Armatimonadota bacterium]